MKISKVLLVGLVMVFVFGVVSAQGTLPTKVTEAVNLDENIQAADLGIGEPTLLPDHPFYFLKNWFRGIRLFFAFNPLAKAQLRERFANEKLMELKKMVEEKKGAEAIKKATENYQKEIEKIKEVVEKIKQKAKENPQVESFLDKFIHQQTLHQKLLERLEKQVPPQAFEKIKKAREGHLERFKDVMLKLEDRKEKITEKLEKTLEKQKGSEFKEFKNLGILKELEEIVPERAKEAIQKVRDKIAEKFEKKLEKMPLEKQEKFKEYVERIAGDKVTHLKVLSGTMGGEISDQLREKLKEIEEKKIKEIEKLKITAERAKAQIEKGGKEIERAEDVAKTIDPQVYRGKAVLKLLELAKEHLKRAKEAFGQEKYGKAFGLATASYQEALNCQRIAKMMEAIQKSPQKLKEKFKELYPGIPLPEKITKCKLIAPPRCPQGKVSAERDENGCPLFKCLPLPKLEKSKPPKEKVLCSMIWDPVCGTDGKTYSNACWAKVAGVEIAHRGICETKCAEVGERVNRNPLLGPTDRVCCPGLIEVRVSRSYSICKKPEEEITPEIPGAPETRCREDEVKKYRCPDGTLVNWCYCHNQRWVCKISPEIACPGER